MSYSRGEVYIIGATDGWECVNCKINGGFPEGTQLFQTREMLLEHISEHEDGHDQDCGSAWWRVKCEIAEAENAELRGVLKLVKLVPRPWIPGAKVTWPEWDSAMEKIDAALKGQREVKDAE